MRITSVFLLVCLLCVSIYASDEGSPVNDEAAEVSRQDTVESDNRDEPVVTIAGLGQVRGSRMSSASGREILAFRGVPYAEPPVADFRFRDPKAIKAWEGVIDATAEAPACLQYDVIRQVVRGSEDCLKLNVYTHDTVAKGWPKPVMVWIHGGGFAAGSGNGDTDFYGPAYLLDRDVVLVTVNYRLGAFGFISTEDAEAPGNYGLLDQSMALRWVKHNIRNFGGDPESITIFGESAGGASVEFHMLSPYSKGLFQRAISQSGSLFSSWAMFTEVAQYTRLLAQYVGCPIATSREIVECLRTKDANEIAAFCEKIKVFGLMPAAFGPRIDSERKSPFLPGEPSKLIAEKRFYSVPYITGVNQNEGALIQQIFQDGELMKKFNENPQKYMRYFMHLDFQKDGDSIVKKVLERYVNLGQPLEDQPNQMDKMLSDALFFHGAEISTNLFSTYSERPVYSYFYSHSYSSSLAHPYGITYSADDHKVCHGDGLVMLFHQTDTPLLASENDKKISNVLLDLWTSFAARGTPKSDSLVSQWLPRDVNNTRYLSIETKRQMMVHRDPPYAVRMPFWNQLSSPVREQGHIRDEL